MARPLASVAAMVGYWPFAASAFDDLWQFIGMLWDGFTALQP
jgi:hypothetical protein